MPQRKIFELSDCPKFAFPNIWDVDVVATAANIVERLQGKSFMSYGSLWPRVGDVVLGRVDDEYLKQNLSIYTDEWKNKNLQDVMRLLAEVMGGQGRWYRAGLKPFEVMKGAFFKPSIKGTWFKDGVAYSTLINARKGQRLHDDHIKFLARGVYEFHSIDDPNDPVPLIIDASAPVSNEEREVRTFVLDQTEMMPLVRFEQSLRRFFEALALAGVTTIPEDVEHIGDLFRRRPF